ncbi:S9 family peptidase [Vallicoccus soli]|uniref:S9 family peptidase n=1 Tax=Vallicoccus soli TaxID=2339232 RepID=A0A3A3Z2Z5_9ACTN|nr:S9 family peptidase [Vallicoccus soli]RJK97782.1 S9 family peptidase [Vallicoccus soli]
MPEETDATPFHDPAAHVALARTTGLALSPDGTRLVATVASLAPDRTAYRSALWEVDPAGGRPAHRLTRSAEGEAGAAPAPGGDLLFLSRRPLPPAPPDAEGRGDGDVAALWALPAGGGEARRLAERPGGFDAVVVARDAGTVVALAPALPGTSGDAEDRARRTAREEAAVTALLHEEGPVRSWDHDLGPAESRLLVVEPGEGDAPAVLRDLTPAPGRALDEQSPVLTPDGAHVVTGWSRAQGWRERVQDLVAVATADGAVRVLAAAEPDAVSWGAPAVSPDGRLVACLREGLSGYDRVPTLDLCVVDLEGGEPRVLTAGFDLRPGRPVFTGDGAALLFTADEQGHRPVFRLDLATGAVVRLTRWGAYDALCPSSDGRHVFALSSSYEHPAEPVRLDAAAPDQDPVPLRGPVPRPQVPGRLEEVRTRAEDGTPLRAWLVLPPGASPDAPAPLLLWIHGGPLGSWNDWSWRWNPHLMAARGWAVLLPDPALSTGYGDAFVQRGWGRWGAEPFTDLMAVTDAALERGDLDAGRTAAMGGSFGGYMANWVATRTDRFRAIVTHASLWALDQFVPTTDVPAYWAREWGAALEQPERYEAWSPHRYADRIRTPMLVVHGDRDYRVPIGEGLRLWSDLQRLGVPSRFLYYPDENHWVLGPGNARVWYETVFAFLDHHVLGREWRRPELL